MSLDHESMQRSLQSLGCRSIHKIKKVIEYMLPNTKESFYLHKENIYPQIVIRPALQVFLTDLSSIEGVQSKDPYYHNDDMAKFPKRRNKGKDEVHYGLAFEFDNVLAVEEFLSKLLDIVTSAAK